MDVKVKEYRSQGAFQGDAQRMARDGWTVQSVTDRPQRAGCLRILLTGGIALVWKPPSRVMVTYQREERDREL